MNVGTLDAIPLDDIVDYYGEADKYTKRAVSLLLEDGSVRWWLATLNGKRISEGGGKGTDPLGYGIYKCEGQLLPQLIATGLSPMQSEETHDLATTAVAVWIMQGGGMPVLKTIKDKMERMGR